MPLGPLESTPAVNPLRTQGFVSLAHGDLAKARQCFDTVVRDQPAQALPLAREVAALKQPKLAKHLFRVAAKTAIDAPTAAIALEDLGDAYDLLADQNRSSKYLQGAANAWRAAAQANPTSYGAHARRAQLLLGQTAFALCDTSWEDMQEAIEARQPLPMRLDNFDGQGGLLLLQTLGAVCDAQKLMPVPAELYYVSTLFALPIERGAPLLAFKGAVAPMLRCLLMGNLAQPQRADTEVRQSALIGLQQLAAQQWLHKDIVATLSEFLTAHAPLDPALIGPCTAALRALLTGPEDAFARAQLQALGAAPTVEKSQMAASHFAPRLPAAPTWHPMMQAKPPTFRLTGTRDWSTTPFAHAISADGHVNVAAIRPQAIAAASNALLGEFMSELSHGSVRMDVGRLLRRVH